jgi:hypothetical protein
MFSCLLNTKTKSPKKGAQIRKVFKNSFFGSGQLPFAARMEDDVSFVTLGALFGTARLRSRSVQDL